MTRDDLYTLEREVNKNIERIKREQEQYRKGVEDGIELMFRKVREHLAKEEEAAFNEAKAKKRDCGNCKNRNTEKCKHCVTSYNAIEPSHWEPMESEDTE